MRGKVRRINAVKIIERQRGKVCALSGRYLKFGCLETRRRGANIRIPILRFLDEFIKTYERRRKLCVIDDGEIQVEVGKEQDGKIQPALVHGKLGFAQIALAIVVLDLGFDHISVRHFTAIFQLLAQREKLLRFRRSLLHVGIFALRGDQPVIALHYGHDQPAFGNFRLGARHRFKGLALR